MKPGRASQKDIHVAHIFIPIHKEDSAVQIQKAQAKINKAYEAAETTVI